MCRPRPQPSPADRHAAALHRLRAAHATLEARIRRVNVNKRDRDREIVELHVARRRRADGGGNGGKHVVADTARLRRLLARRHMCDLSASRFEQLLTVVEQQMQQLEDWAALEQTTSALRGGAAAGAEQQRLLGGIEAVDTLLAELGRQRDDQQDIQRAMDEFNRFDSMADDEAEEELHRLIDDEHIADQFSEGVPAPDPLGAAPAAPVEDPLMTATERAAGRAYDEFFAPELA